MGNIVKVLGPLPRSWIAAQLELSRLVVKRMRELGIKIVHPGFAGFVPEAAKRCVYI